MGNVLCTECNRREKKKPYLEQNEKLLHQANMYVVVEDNTVILTCAVCRATVVKFYPQLMFSAEHGSYLTSAQCVSEQ